MIYEIEDWVLNQSLSDLVKFKDLFHKDVTISVNFSGLHLKNKKIIRIITEILDKHNLHPHDLVIELTESILMTDMKSKESPLQCLVNQKIQLNIDDFGTGYSSLAYLHTIPATAVKVDRSFIEHIEHNTTTLKCIHRLVNALSMKTIMEGIETEQQAILVHSLGYTFQQGYFHGRPQPIDYYLKG